MSTARKFQVNSSKEMNLLGTPRKIKLTSLNTLFESLLIDYGYGDKKSLLLLALKMFSKSSDW